jgi:hypothetical protein
MDVCLLHAAQLSAYSDAALANIYCAGNIANAGLLKWANYHFVNIAEAVCLLACLKRVPCQHNNVATTCFRAVS